MTASVSTQNVASAMRGPTSGTPDSSSTSQKIEPMKPYSIHTTMALMWTMRLTLKSSTPNRKSGHRNCAPASSPKSICARKSTIATVKYFTDSRWAKESSR